MGPLPGDSRYPNVFQPQQIGGCTIKNRIVRTAHSTGARGDDLIAYHEARARGGVGLAIIEIAGGVDFPAAVEAVLALLRKHATDVEG